MVLRFETRWTEVRGIGRRFRQGPKGPALACGENGAPAKPSRSQRACHWPYMITGGYQVCYCPSLFGPFGNMVYITRRGLLTLIRTRCTIPPDPHSQEECLQSVGPNEIQGDQLLKNAELVVKAASDRHPIERALARSGWRGGVWLSSRTSLSRRPECVTQRRGAS